MFKVVDFFSLFEFLFIVSVIRRLSLKMEKAKITTIHHLRQYNLARMWPILKHNVASELGNMTLKITRYYVTVDILTDAVIQQFPTL